ncbi:MAG: tRNA threonylcarbamoyladenosine dehydratase [Clostridia bacterium]|nr:tRNA threonylcarbamoyladenosine dehydratase [Clostridia bacterium]
MDQFARSAPLFGAEGMDRLSRARVAVFGVGGVGGYAAEALVRSGVGSIDVFDNDTVGETNLNRQIIALHSTLGQSKAEVMARRLRDINPQACVTAHELFYLPENADSIDLTQYDFIVDAVDTVTAKLELITRADYLHVPIISAMGAGNKLDPTQLRTADIYDTRECRLARIIRSECRKHGVKKLPVVYSTEPPVVVAADTGEAPPGSRRALPASAVFVPAAMGLIIASEVVRRLAGI